MCAHGKPLRRRFHQFSLPFPPPSLHPPFHKNLDKYTFPSVASFGYRLRSVHNRLRPPVDNLPFHAFPVFGYHLPAVASPFFLSSPCVFGGRDPDL